MATTEETDDIRPGRLALSVGKPGLPSPEGWTWVKLRRIAEMATGHTPSRGNSNYWGGSIPWIKAKDARPVDGGVIHDSNEYTNEEGIENSSAVVLPEGTVCLSRTGSIGYSVILGRPMATSQGFVNWICSDAINPRFLQALFILERPFLEEIAEGSAHETVYLSEAKAFHVCLPPLKEQRRIADRLDSIQSRTQATGETLAQVPDRIEEYRQSVLNIAFTGQLTAEWRRTHDPEPANRLLERILDERRDRWEEDYRTKRYDSKGKTPPDGWKDRYTEPESVDSSGLPSLPSSWKWVRFEEISLLDSGYAFSSDKFTDEGMPLLRGANVAPGHLKWGDTEYWPEDEVGPYEHLIVEEGDIILAMDRPLINAGLKIARAEESDTPCLLVQRVARFKPVLESLTSFLYLACSTQQFITHLRDGQTGTQIPHVSKKSLRAYPVPLPPLAEQKEIVRRINQRLDKIGEMAQHVNRAHDRLDHLDRSVLAKAFRGELVETEAERAHREDRDYETAEELLERVQGESSSDDQSTSSEEQSSTTSQVGENGQLEMRVVEDDPDL